MACTKLLSAAGELLLVASCPRLLSSKAATRTCLTGCSLFCVLTCASVFTWLRSAALFRDTNTAGLNVLQRALALDVFLFTVLDFDTVGRDVSKHHLLRGSYVFARGSTTVGGPLPGWLAAMEGFPVLAAWDECTKTFQPFLQNLAEWECSPTGVVTKLNAGAQ